MRSIQLVHRKRICTKLFGIYNVAQSWVGNEARNQNFSFFAAFTMYTLVVILQSHDAEMNDDIRRSATILVGMLSVNGRSLVTCR